MISWSSGFKIFRYVDVWQGRSVILLHVCLCIFSSNRCRFAKMNVNCLFTVSWLVQFTHRSFPIQSPAAVCLSFTSLIGSGFRKTTLKKKKNIAFQNLTFIHKSPCCTQRVVSPVAKQIARSQRKKNITELNFPENQSRRNERVMTLQIHLSISLIRPS